MQNRSRKWFVILMLCLIGCSTYNASLLDDPFDSDVTYKPFDAGATSGDSSIGQQDSSMDRRTGLGDGFAPIDDAGGDDEPLDSSDEASRMDVTALDATIDAETEDAQDDIDSSSEPDAETEMDGTVDPDAEASADAQQDTGLPACEGTRLFDLCWYLTEPDQSCDEFCADHRGFDSNTANHVGSTDQGGSAENCSDILGALGFSDEVSSGNRGDDLGFGCHLWDGDPWWLSSPDFAPDVFLSPVRVACACLE